MSAPVVGLVAKSRQETALDHAIRVLEWLRAKSITCHVDSEVAAHAAIDGAKVIPREKISSTCDIVVVLGGDGTLLSVARYPAEKPPVIIGVNIGTLGFLTDIPLDDLFPALELALSGKAELQKRSLISARVQAGGREKNTYYALNDVVITKDAVARLFGVEMHVDGEYAATVRGDGVIISSPSGSTAYSLSAGGSIVHPGVNAILVTPICPHSLTSRPLVLPATSSLMLRVETHAGATTEVFLTIDGQEGMALSAGSTVTVETSRYFANFLTLPSASYFRSLGSKLKWASP